MIRILFQGDSITDSNRTKESDDYLGSGYPNFVSGILGTNYPEKFEFINRGVSGNKVTDLYLRIRKDIIDLKPDVISILIGINDVWHEVDNQNGVNNEKFIKIYRILLDEIKEALPECKIIIMEPYVLKGSATNETEEVWDYFYKETMLRAESSKKIAEEYDAVFVPLQEMFDKLQEKVSDTEYWLSDGVHPTAKGAYLIAEQWMKYFKENFIKL